MINAFSLNLDEIILSNNTPRAIKEMAREMQTKEYFTIGEFFSSMSDKNLDELMELVEKTRDEINSGDSGVDATANMTLFSLMLLVAEGGTITEEGSANLMMATVAFCVAESLKRKDLADCIYENWTLFEEGLSNEIIKLRIGPDDLNDLLEDI